MEFEVRAVGEISSCFVSLPLSLIQTLQSTAVSGYLPPVLALELRARSSADGLWHVAWSGSASSPPFSTSILIAQRYAECIGLPDRAVVQVKVVRTLPKATLVTVEPCTEDDWEVLELNSELAEEAILKQVGILHQAMKFPLWLYGKTVITFLVDSTFPGQSVVQLVPGTEVAVAPKRRKRTFDSHEDSSFSMSKEEQSTSKALLRIQDADNRFIHACCVNDVEIEVVLTSVVFIHPETANKYSFSPLEHLVILPRLWSYEGKNYEVADAKQMNGGGIAKETNSEDLTDKQHCHQAIVRLLLSESVARGHVMLSRSLRLYLRAGLHSWLYLKRDVINLKKEIPAFSLSPCQFKFSKNAAFENHTSELLRSHKSSRTEYMLQSTSSDTKMGVIDWSSHGRIIATLSLDGTGNKDKESLTKLDITKGISAILNAWFQAQLEATGVTGDNADSLLLANKTLVHLKLKGKRILKHGKVQVFDDCDTENRSQTGEPSIDILYVLFVSGDSLLSGKIDAYKLSFDRAKGSALLGGLDVFVGKLQLADGISIRAPKERIAEKGLQTEVSSLNWMGTAASDVINRLIVLLSFTPGMMFSAYDLPLPGHVLIHGPPGSGKTLLATVAAKTVAENKEIVAYIVPVHCSRLALQKTPSIRRSLSGYISEALDHAPSVVIFDDLDSILGSSDIEGSQPSSSSVALTEFLADIIDDYEDKRKSACGIGPLAFIACAQSISNIPQALSSSGRFDFHVKLPAPAAAERGALLKREVQKRSLKCSHDVIFDVASKCDGYDAYDLEILVDRAVHAAISRLISGDMVSGGHENTTLVRDDFLHAMRDFLPISMRDITKPASEGGRSGWEDIGGLNDIRDAIKEMIELPSKFPNIFAHAPLRLRSNVLLYGPPGCGKTHIVGAAAAACSLRFISVKGPELLNKYIGASEQAVRDIFSKATAASPCILFFDEFDSIAPKRGHDNTGVTDRVVNQFLTELDGVEVLMGVFVFAATSRPDLLDAALLRPGRLDRLLFCDFPSRIERLDILKVLSRKLPLASDVDLNGIAEITEGFSGADLQALLSDAQLEAVHDLLDSEDTNSSGKMPVITNAILLSVAKKAKPSVPETEKRRLYNIYNQFLDSKRSIAAQSRDAKGKRATLA